jgi:hypothetical protein
MEEKPTAWFLISWPERGVPQIVMEFWTREEAESALELTHRISADVRGRPERVSTSVCPASVLLHDPFMQQALLAWDDQLDEFESIEREVLRGRT